MFLVLASKNLVAAVYCFLQNPSFTNSEGNLINKTKTFSEERAVIPSRKGFAPLHSQRTRRPTCAVVFFRIRILNMQQRWHCLRFCQI